MLLCHFTRERVHATRGSFSKTGNLQLDEQGVIPTLEHSVFNSPDAPALANLRRSLSQTAAFRTPMRSSNWELSE
jgi:hypothetical protein